MDRIMVKILYKLGLRKLAYKTSPSLYFYELGRELERRTLKEVRKYDKQSYTCRKNDKGS